VPDQQSSSQLELAIARSSRAKEHRNTTVLQLSTCLLHCRVFRLSHHAMTKPHTPLHWASPDSTNRTHLVGSSALALEAVPAAPKKATTTKARTTNHPQLAAAHSHPNTTAQTATADSPHPTKQPPPNLSHGLPQPHQSTAKKA
jgi:hypothetical protein